MKQAKETCQECLGVGKVAKASAVLNTSLRPTTCKTCEGTGVTDPIMNSAFLNNINSKVIYG